MMVEISKASVSVMRRKLREAIANFLTALGGTVQQQFPTATTPLRRMKRDEAFRILELQEATATREEILERCEQLIKLNEVEGPRTAGPSGGSPYLQEKVRNARTILLEAFEEGNRRNPGAPPPSSSGPPPSSSGGGGTGSSGNPG